MTTDKLARLKTVLDAYGADPARWPDADRVALADILDSPGDLVAESREAAEIDQVLAAAGAPAIPAGANAKLAQLAQNTPQNTPIAATATPHQTFGVSRFAAVSTLAASLCVGVFMGALGSLDPYLIGDSEAYIELDANDFEDPFDLESLIGNGGEDTG